MRDSELNIITNTDITSREVRVLEENGNQLGIMPTRNALAIALHKDLDLVLISDNSQPPVVKIIDANKYIYAMKKRKKESDKKSRENRINVKEVQFRPVTDIHDIQVKAKKIRKFLTSGDHVKLTIKYRGREASHIDMAHDFINTILSEIGDYEVVTPFKITPNQAGITVSSTNK